MHKQKLEQFMAAQTAELNELFQGQKQVQQKLRDLTSSEGWPYLKDIADSILKDYECKPATTGEEAIKWQTYTQMKWALDQLLGKVLTLTLQPIPEPKQVGRINADNRPSRPRAINTSPPSRNR